MKISTANKRRALWLVAALVVCVAPTGRAQNVGIGTATPQTRLDVAGEIRIGNTGQTAASAGAGALRWFGGGIEFSDGAAWLPVSSTPGWALTGNAGTSLATNFIGTTDAQPLAMRTTNIIRMLVHQNGNVGIGTVIPATRFHVIGGGGIRASTTNPGTGFTDWIGLDVGGAAGDRLVAGLLNGVATLGAHNTALTAWRPLQISAPGFNVGIGGTAPPTQQLEVNGGLRIGNTTTGGAGSLRWTGSTFEGHNGGAWLSLINTDAQTLSIAGQNLTIAGGNTITLPPATTDNLGNHTATQNVQLGAHWLSGDGGNEGLSVNANGNVGVGVASAAHLFQVVGPSIAIPTVDQSQTVTNATVPSDIHWQSFTAGISGSLASIVLNCMFASNSNPASVQVFQGVGVSGPLLFNAPITLPTTTGVFSVPISGTVNLVAGQHYTFRIVSNGFYVLAVNQSNPYAGGEYFSFFSGPQPTWDLWFQTIVNVSQQGNLVFDGNTGRLGVNTSTPVQALDVHGGLRIGNTALGSAGSIRWTGTTFEGHNGSAWLAFSDNLGNHTATQNVVLGPHFMSGDGDPEGVFVNVNGNVGIGGILTPTPARLSVSGTRGINVNTTNLGTGYTDWIGLSVGGLGGDRLVGGLLNGRATLGAHNDALTAWRPLQISEQGFNVGIGTASPIQQLDVNGGLRIGNTTLGSAGSIRWTGTTFEGHNGGVWLPLVNTDAQTLSIAGQNLTIAGGNTITLPLPPPGADNLGNHIANQNVQLGAHWLSGDGGNEGIRVGSEGMATLSTTNPGSGTANWIALSAGGTAGNRVVGGLLNGVATLGAHNNALSAWAGLSLNPGGGVVEVGSPAPYTPSFKFVVQGNSLLQGTTRIVGTADADGLTVNGGGYVHNNLIVSGNIGIGTATPNDRLQVHGNAFILGNLTNMGQLTSIGTVSFCNGPYTCSDARYKTNVQPLQNATELLACLRPVRYEFRTDTAWVWQFPKGAQFGLIAQEMEHVFPEMVSADSTGYRSVNYQALVPWLLRALQEQQAQLQALQTENAQLHSQADSRNQQLVSLEASLGTVLRRLQALESALPATVFPTTSARR